MTRASGRPVFFGSELTQREAALVFVL